MKKILLAILLILVFAVTSHAATYYGVKGSSNWTSGNWSTTSTKDATRTGSGVTPTASDTCILDDWTSDGGGVTWTIDSTSAVCGVVDTTSYAGTLNFGTGRLAASGNVTIGTGLTVAGTGTLRINAAGNLDGGGKTIPILDLNAPVSTALQSNLTVGTLLVNSSNAAFTGAYDVTTNILTFYTSGATLTFPAGQTLTVKTEINMALNGFGKATLKSSSGTDMNLAYSGLASAAKIAGATFTAVAASGTNMPLYNWFGSGVDAVAKNILIVTPASFPAAADVLSSAYTNGSGHTAGTFDEAARNTDPGEANVKNGETYKIQNVDKTGTYVGGVWASGF